eukprot:COSAG06_NODE_42119_length_384_cov_1.554386_1_plen_26_part_10
MSEEEILHWQERSFLLFGNELSTAVR